MHICLPIPQTPQSQPARDQKSSASKSALPLVFPVSANDSDLYPIPQAKILGTIFSSSSLILPKDLVTKSVGSPNIFQIYQVLSYLCLMCYSPTLFSLGLPGRFFSTSKSRLKYCLPVKSLLIPGSCPLARKKHSYLWCFL